MLEKFDNASSADKRESWVEKQTSRLMNENKQTHKYKVDHLLPGAQSISTSENPQHVKFAGLAGRLLKEYGSPEEIPIHEQEAAAESFGFDPEMTVALAIKITEANQRYN